MWGKKSLDLRKDPQSCLEMHLEEPMFHSGRVKTGTPCVLKEFCAVEEKKKKNLGLASLPLGILGS